MPQFGDATIAPSGESTAAVMATLSALSEGTFPKNSFYKHDYKLRLVNPAGKHPRWDVSPYFSHPNGSFSDGRVFRLMPVQQLSASRKWVPDRGTAFYDYTEGRYKTGPGAGTATQRDVTDSLVFNIAFTQVFYAEDIVKRYSNLMGVQPSDVPLEDARWVTKRYIEDNTFMGKKVPPENQLSIKTLADLTLNLMDSMARHPDCDLLEFRE